MLSKLPRSVISFCIAALLLSCNNSSSAKDSKGNTKDTAPSPDVAVPVTAPEITVAAPVAISATTKCYSNEGLKYATTITINFTAESAVTGSVSSTELGSGKEEKTSFTGNRNGNTLSIKFEGTPPVIGAASEWTTKPWTIEEVEGKSNWKEKLHIPFIAKNYDTNKWEDTDYEFVLVPCK